VPPAGRFTRTFAILLSFLKPFPSKKLTSSRNTTDKRSGIVSGDQRGGRRSGLLFTRHCHKVSAARHQWLRHSLLCPVPKAPWCGSFPIGIKCERRCAKRFGVRRLDAALLFRRKLIPRH